MKSEFCSSRNAKRNGLFAEKTGLCLKDDKTSTLRPAIDEEIIESRDILPKEIVLSVLNG
jgi:hypothetical protein